MESYKKLGGLFCIDWDKAGFKLFGSKSDANHSVVDFVAAPCGLSETVLGGKQNYIREDCNWSKTAALDYVSDFNVVMYYNLGRFQPDIVGGAEPIMRSSVVFKTRAD